MSSYSDSNRSRQTDRQLLIANLEKLGEVASTETALFHHAVAESMGLGITDVKALSALLHEGSMAAGAIAERLNVTTGAATNVIDRLEKHGLVRRESDPRDRRKVIVKANQDVLDAESNPYKSMGESFGALLATYTTKELEFLVNYYQDLIELTQQEIASL